LHPGDAGRSSGQGVTVLPGGGDDRQAPQGPSRHEDPLRLRP